MAIAIENFITVGRAAALLGDINPLVISNMIYKRQLDSSRCPLVNRRRRIPLDYLPEIAEQLRRCGYAVPLIQEPASGA